MPAALTAPSASGADALCPENRVKAFDVLSWPRIRLRRPETSDTCWSSRPAYDGKAVGSVLARYYDPATAQFLTRDPDVATTLSPYGYVDGDPINSIDPSGQSPADPDGPATCGSGVATPFGCWEPGIPGGGLDGGFNNSGAGGAAAGAAVVALDPEGDIGAGTVAAGVAAVAAVSYLGGALCNWLFAKNEGTESEIPPGSVPGDEAVRELAGGDRALQGQLSDNLHRLKRGLGGAASTRVRSRYR